MSRKGKPIIKRRATARDTRALPGYTIKQAFDYFVSVKQSEGIRERTARDYVWQIEYFTEWLGEFYPAIAEINEVSTTLLREYIVYLSTRKINETSGKTGLSPYTINIRIRFLKAFFNTLHTEGIIADNPAHPIKLMRVDEDQYELLTDEEIERLFDVPDTAEYAQFRDLVMMYFALETGARINEICTLEVEEVDFRTRSVVIPAHKNKNRKPRILPLTNYMTKLLLELITENRQHFDSKYVFLSNSGTRYRANSFRRRLLIYRDKAGIKKRVSPHSFRHLFCVKMALNGCDIFTLQRLAGHADISTTRKYVQLSDEDIRSQHAKFAPTLRLRKR